MQEGFASAVPVTVADQLAGFVVHDAAGLRFVAADRRFDLLDGSRFPRLDAARHAAARIARLVLLDAAEDGELAPWRDTEGCTETRPSPASAAPASAAM